MVPLGHRDLREILNEIPRIRIPNLPDSETKQEKHASNSRPQRIPLAELNHPAVIIRSRIPSLGDSGIGLTDAETSTVTSFEDDDDDDDDDDEDEDEDKVDISERLHQSIRQVFSATPEFANRVIDCLAWLSPDRRERVYGYGATSSRGTGSSHGSSDSGGYDGGSGPNKRKRTEETSPSGLAQNQLRDNNDQESQVLVDDQSPGALPLNRRFACAYNIFDRGKYSPRIAVGRNATRYKSCAGPGFKSLNHYKYVERPVS